MDKWKKIKRKDLKSLGEAPAEASENIQAPELAPRDKRFTGRTKKIGLMAFPEFHHEIKRLALEENCLIIEVLERAVKEYKKTKQNKT